MARKRILVGRVAVKVSPDTSGFRKELQRELNAIEKSMRKIQIGV